MIKTENIFKYKGFEINQMSDTGAIFYYVAFPISTSICGDFYFNTLEEAKSFIDGN